MITAIFERMAGDWKYQLSVRPENVKVYLCGDYSQPVAIDHHTLLVGTPSEFGNSACVFDLCAPQMLDCK